MSKVIEQCQDIVFSAKGFDSFLAGKMFELGPVEVAVSQRLSLIIKEAETVLSKMVNDFNNSKNVEIDRLRKFEDELNIRDKELKLKAFHLQKEQSILLNMSNQFTVSKNEFHLEESKYNSRRIKLDNDLRKYKEDLRLLNKDRVQVDVDKKSIKEDKENIKNQYEDIRQKYQIIKNKEKEIADFNLSKKKQQVSEWLAEIEIKRDDLRNIEIDLNSYKEELDIRLKNIQDKDKNLKNYKEHIDIEMGKLRKELVETKRKVKK